MKHISVEPFTPTVLERVWGTETIVANAADYLAKVLVYKAGKAGGLQAHRVKDETFYLLSGEAWVDYDDGTGTLVRVKMVPGEAYHIPPGAVHRVEAISDCVMVEGSSRHFDDRVRMEEVYNTPVIGDAYGLETTEP